MNVLLVQPPDPPVPVPPISLSGGSSTRFTPPWDLLCLRAYLLVRTRHRAKLIDCRIFSDLEEELVRAAETFPQPFVFVVNATSHALGQTAAVLEIAKRNFPHAQTVLCGEFPSQFPDQIASVTRVDYALSGDPEPILRNLLDYRDLPQRLQRVPGLISNEVEHAAPYWLSKLHALSLPEWDDITWSAYHLGLPTPGALAEARISRGHTRLPADRAYGNAHEPLRIWPLDRVARVVQRCAALGITEVFLADPPAVWTPTRLDEWCAALQRIRNTQPWSLQMLPTSLSADTINTMQFLLCRRIDFVFPSCDAELLKRYGCILKPRDIASTIAELQRLGVDVHVRFWVGGPEESSGEQERVVQMIHELNYPAASLHAYPFFMNSPLYEELSQSHNIPDLDDWIHWYRDPWTVDRPVPLWQGAPGVEELQRMFAEIQRSVQRSPKRVLLRVLNALRSRNWIDFMEDKAVGLLPKATPPEH